MRSLLAAVWIVWAALGGIAGSHASPGDVDVLHYDIELELYDTSESIEAASRVHVRMMRDGITTMRLDFAGMQMDSLKVNGVPASYSLGDDGLLVEFHREFARGEIAVVEARYHGRPKHGLRIGVSRHGRRVFLSENWPDYAHFWFPCIDNPSDKATVQLTITAPQAYAVVSNGTLIQSLLLPEGRKITRWSEHRPIPTYSIAFCASEFVTARQPAASGVPSTLYYYPEDAQAVKGELARTATAMRYFTSLIAPYPYERLSQVQAPVLFEAMENAGAIFYKDTLFGKAHDSRIPMAHELAHQWFGNSVTQCNWDHLWLSEGFATYFDALFEGYLKGPGTLKSRMARYADTLMASREARVKPVIDRSQTGLMEKLNALNYEKGAWVLHMLRGVTGDATFFRGIRRYYALHEGRNACSEDFQRVMETISGLSLDAFFRQWLYQPGWPDYWLSWEWDAKSRELILTVRQEQTGGLFDMNVDVLILSQKGREKRKLHLFKAEQTFRISLSSPPIDVRLDPEGWLLKSVRVKGQRAGTRVVKSPP